MRAYDARRLLERFDLDKHLAVTSPGEPAAEGVLA
jgi:hypothetical protein